MSVSKDRVIHTSVLARLDFTLGASEAEAEAKVTTFAKEMEGIVAYMDILDSADTDGVEPLFSPIHFTAPPREDDAITHFERAEVLKNAPESEDGFFVVPQVL